MIGVVVSVADCKFNVDILFDIVSVEVNKDIVVCRKFEDKLASTFGLNGLVVR